MTATLGLIFIFCTASLVILGDYLIKIATDRGHGVMSGLVMSGCALYAVSVLMWFYALHHVTLSQAGVTQAICTLLALCTFGVVVFSQPLPARQFAGVGGAVIALCLMLRLI